MTTVNSAVISAPTQPAGETVPDRSGLDRPGREEHLAAPTPSARSPLEAMIAAARVQPASMRVALLASCLSALLMYLSFPPVGLGALAWIAPLPLLLLVKIEKPTRRMLLASYLGGLAFWLPALQWMRLGDPTMYPAWFALATYLAAYTPAFVFMSRTLVHRWRWPLVVAAPLVWVGLEFARGSLLLTGFGWYLLGHSQHRWIELIQVCDVIGTYGLGGIVLLPACFAATMIPEVWLGRWGFLPPADAMHVELLKAADQARTTRWYLVRAAVPLAVVAMVLGYGYARRGMGEFKAGPRVALVQANIPAVVNPRAEDWPRAHQRYMRLTGQAVREQPDLVVWPEGMFRWPQLVVAEGVTPEQLAASPRAREIEHLQQLDVPQRLKNIAEMSGAAFLTGLTTLEATPTGLRYYNSAGFVLPQQGYVGRYDKMHRVPFGEYVPLVEYLPFLAGFTPYADSTGLTAGTAPRIFEYKQVRYAPVICYEDTVAAVVRRVVRQTGEPDVLVNVSNDGWFHGSSEHDQHLLTSVFRCVETRTPMVRAANMGISAIIDGDGVVRAQARDLETGASKACDAVVVDHVPLDPRSSVYLTTGDWPAAACSWLCGLVALSGFRRRT
jgi:apolipoprotein N-acyltransferase